MAVVGMPGLYGEQDEAVYVFARSLGGWCEIARHRPPDAAPGTSFAFGIAVSVDQNDSETVTIAEGLTTGEVAARLATSEGSVKRHLARARRKLRGVLDE